MYFGADGKFDPKAEGMTKTYSGAIYHLHKGYAYYNRVISDGKYLRYYDANGKFVATKNGYVKVANGQFYLYKGCAYTNKLVTVNGNLFYCGANGVFVKGKTFTIGAKVYKAAANGVVTRIK